MSKFFSDFLNQLPQEVAVQMERYLDNELIKALDTMPNIEQDENIFTLLQKIVLQKTASYKYLGSLAETYFYEQKKITFCHLFTEKVMRKIVHSKYKDFLVDKKLFLDFLERIYIILLKYPGIFFQYESQFKNYLTMRLREFNILFQTEFSKKKQLKENKRLDIYLYDYNIGIELKRGSQPKHNRDNTQRLLYEDWFECPVLLVYASDCHDFLNKLNTLESTEENINALRILF